MGEQIEDQPSDVDMNNPELTFDSLTILKEFSNIANLVKNDDFLETVPKAKLRRVKWDSMFNCLKQGILDEMVQELSAMWQYENMQEKLEILEKQKEKFADINTDKTMWRPELGNVKVQVMASDVGNLQKQKALLESLAKEYEGRVNRLKKTVSAKRGYLKALQLDIQKYQEKNEEFITIIDSKFENHQNIIKSEMPIRMNIDELNWVENDLQIEH